MRTFTLGMLLIASACADKAGSDTDSTTDTDADTTPQPAALITPTMKCPTLPEPGSAGMITIGEGDDARTAWISVPSAPTEKLPLWFGWHGLTPTNYEPAYQGFAAPFGLKSVSEDKGVVIVAPAARVQSLAVAEAYLWGILDQAGHDADIALYDNLLACIAGSLDIDLRRVSSFGFSGGALWTSVLLMDRADTLAGAVTMSGGVDILNGNPIMAWRDPGELVNAMVVSGGPNDAWPTPSAALINFGVASDALTTHLNEAGDTVIRCDHTYGHAAPPSDQVALAWRFMMRGRYGVPSAWASDSPPPVATGCEITAP